MDRQNKHLSSEDRGVIFAEHIRGSSQQMIGRLLGRPASTISRELARGRQDDGAYCPLQLGLSTMSGANGAGADENLLRAATSIASFMASSYICTGHLSRLRTDYSS